MAAMIQASQARVGQDLSDAVAAGSEGGKEDVAAGAFLWAS